MIKKQYFKVCIFCGSNKGKLKSYENIAFLLGKELSKKNFKVIYGGGKVGLMGAISQGVIQNGGYLISVVPSVFKNKIDLEKKSTEIIFTSSIAKRKEYMIKSSNMFIVLPGGFGTYDELFEVISLNQLGIINKKIVFLNINNFFKSLKLMINDLKKEGFLYTNINNRLNFLNSVNKTIKFVENHIK